MNLLDQIPLTTRRVLLDAPSVTVSLARPYQASEADLWDALTDPARLEYWFEPVTGSLRVGGTYRLDSGVSGEILECLPEQRLALTWEGGTVTVTLAEAERGTLLTLTHTFTADEHWDTYGPAATGIGWDSSLVALDLHLAMDDGDDSGDEATFLRALADVWAAADPEEAGVAKQKAERTTEFYLG